MKTYTVRVFDFNDNVIEKYTFSTSLDRMANLDRVRHDVNMTHGTNYKNFTLIEEVLIAYEKPNQTSDNLVQKGQSYPNL